MKIIVFTFTKKNNNGDLVKLKFTCSSCLYRGLKVNKSICEHAPRGVSLNLINTLETPEMLKSKPLHESQVKIFDDGNSGNHTQSDQDDCLSDDEYYY